MRLFVMRHGEAELMAKSDKERHLNARGKEQSSTQGMWLKSTAPVLDKVLVSPYARALETFHQINEVYDQKLTDKLEIWDGITPYGDSGMVSEYLSVLAEDGVENVLLISHLPLVGDIVKEMCGRNPASFYPATIAEIDLNDDRAEVAEIKYLDKF
ncbi:phosphohistidine phosphatase SixA [Aggregatibacter kilianii]|uniref:phosphohistidine phosphatase SixA n=1 Tax=Aggregatibacter kilianii TaxID=2025884 RepID=UPI000D64528C|nr:phosphohistidine phosphatase SixA [Aggregatibacter kilianii]